MLAIDLEKELRGEVARLEQRMDRVVRETETVLSRRLDAVERELQTYTQAIGGELGELRGRVADLEAAVHPIAEKLLQFLERANGAIATIEQHTART